MSMWFKLKKMFTARQIVSFVFSLGLIGLMFSFGDLSTGYEVPKTIWLQWWVRALVVGLWWLVLTLHFSEKILKNRLDLKPLSKNLCIYFGLLIVATVFAAGLGVNWQQSLWGNYYRGDGLITWWHLIALGLLVRWVIDGKKIKIYFPISATICWLLIIISSWWPELSSWLHVGFGNPNISGGFIVVTTPLVVFLMRKFHWSSGLASFFISIMTTIYIGAWGAVASLVLGIVMFWLISQSRLRKLTIMAPILVLTIGVMGLMWWQPVGNSQFTESRVRIFNKLGRAVAQRPILGWGWANVDLAFESVDWPVPTSDDIYVDKAHSQLLGIAVVSGLLGLVVYLLLIGHIYWQVCSSTRLDQSWTQTLFLIFLLYFFHSQTNVTSVVQEAIFWISVGLLVE